MKKMKKLISWLSALCLISALIPASVSAEASVDPGTLNGWTVSGEGSIEIVTDNVGVEAKPVIKWNRTAGGNTTLSYALGTLEEGSYEISVKAKMPGDHGTASFGVIGDMTGGLPNNVDEYITATADVTVTDASSEQSLQITLGGGSATEGYISEVTMKSKDGEITYSENLVANGDFAKEVENTAIGTMDGWEIDERSNFELAEAEVDGVTKPVIKWQYSAEQGHHRYLKCFIGDIPAGEYKVSFNAYIPGNPGGSNFGLSCEGLSPSGLNIGRWNEEYTVVEKTVTVAENKTDQYFQIITDGYGDSDCVYLAEASVCPVNADGTLGENLIKNYNFKNESDTILVSDLEGWAVSDSVTPIAEGSGTYNGATKPTLAWTHANNGVQLKKYVKLYYPLGALEAGTYEYEAILKHTNVGDGRVTVASSGTMQPSSSYTALAGGAGSGGQFINVKGTVTFDSAVDDAQFLIFSNGYGDTGTMHLYDVSVKKVNSNYTYGENIIENSDFRTIELTTNYWTITNDYSHRAIQMDVNGDIKNVLEVYYRNGSGSRISADVGVLVPGTYKLSALMLSAKNAGERFFGITNDSNGGFPDNSKLGNGFVTEEERIPWGNDWKLVEREVTVTNGQVYQAVNFWTGYGDDNAPLYITDLSLCRKNSDGTYGANLVKNPDFTVETVDETVNQVESTVVKGWEMLGSGKENNFTVRTVRGMDGEMTKAAVGYKSSSATSHLQLKQPVATEAGKTYCLSFKAMAEGPVNWAGTRMQAWMDGETEKDYWTLKDIFSGASDWAEYKIYYTMPERDINNNGIAFTTENQLTDGTGAGIAQEQKLIVDDVKFCEVLVAADEATGTEEQLGPNLITNGDFEADNYGVSNLQFAVISDGEVLAGGTEAFIPPTGFDFTASVDFKNGEETQVTPAFIVATYKDGALYNLDVVDNVPVPANTNQTVEWGVTVPENLDDGVYTAKAFVWNSLSGLYPIGGAVTVGEMD